MKKLTLKAIARIARESQVHSGKVGYEPRKPVVATTRKLIWVDG